MLTPFRTEGHFKQKTSLNLYASFIPFLLRAGSVPGPPR